MSEMPQDIWEKANEIYRLIANPTKLEQMANLLTPVERIAYALWAERKLAKGKAEEPYVTRVEKGVTYWSNGLCSQHAPGSRDFAEERMKLRDYEKRWERPE